MTKCVKLRRQVVNWNSLIASGDSLRVRYIGTSDITEIWVFQFESCKSILADWPYILS